MSTKSKARHIRRPLPKEQHQFTVLVDKELFDKANAARSVTWVQLAEDMMRVVLKGKS